MKTTNERAGTYSYFALASLVLFPLLSFPYGESARPQTVMRKKREDESDTWLTMQDPVTEQDSKNSPIAHVESEELIRELLSSGAEDQGCVLAKVRRQLANGDVELFKKAESMLLRYAPQSEEASLSLILEALSAAQVANFDDAVFFAIIQLVGHDSEELRLAAVAAAGDLPRSHRAGLVSAISSIAESKDESASLNCAAKAFISANK